jgi:hypothetical protein
MLEQNTNTLDLDVERFFYPMDTSLNQESGNDVLKMWSKLKLLAQTDHDKLLSSQTAAKIKSICLKFGLENNQSAKVARIIRNYYLENLSKEDFPLILSKEMSVSEKTASEIADLVIKKIINDSFSEEKKEVSIIKMPLSEILKAYPTVNEQLISKNHIKIKLFPEPVRPSVKNWIADYTETLGYTHHTSLQRGEYIFKSENGRILDSEDREKLSQLLKSFDDSVGLEFDTARKQIIFQSPAEPKISIEKTPASQERPPFQAQTGNYCRYAPPISSDTKFHNELPNQIHLEHKPTEIPKNPPAPQAPKPPETPPLQPMRIHPASNGHNLRRDEINPDNIVNLKQ